MSDERWRRVEEVFHRAADLAPGDRADYLTRACAGDNDFRRHVEKLLENDQADGDLIDAAIANAVEQLPVTQESDNLGKQTTTGSRSIGAFRLLQKIGEGGLGEVWLAEQKQPVRRRVALKLIKAGMDTREVIARFESERQALALMDHPAIAKVFDGGSTPEGRPYFAMEYVPGIPITDYCDKHKLGIEERLELFIHVCEGVQHAHQKAVIHRDLKPSNILITEVDGNPTPKIIDFGIAKATSQRFTEETMLTRVGAIIGTPEYMSPEQADSAGEDIDTRTDVYSLGVVLYELLVGSLPLDFTKLSYAELLDRLREQDAPRPSTKAQTSGDNSTIVARNRRVDPPTLCRQLRGDLDAITLKALEKERSRRYATPTELAADIGRYLRHEPVQARPATPGYRARKYIRRHRLGMTVAAAGVLVLVSFAVIEAFQLRRIQRESEQRARVTEFMTNMFQVSDPSAARGNSITAREILDKASKEIATGLAKDPEVQSQMMYVMGYVYANLGLFPRAEFLLNRAIEVERGVLGTHNPQTLKSRSLLGAVLYREGRDGESEKLLWETLDMQRRVLGAEDKDTLSTARRYAQTLMFEGRYAEAEKLQRETIGIQRRVLGPEHGDTMSSMENLGANLHLQGRDTEAEKLLRETLDIKRRVLGTEHLSTLASDNDLAAVLIAQKRYTEGEELLRETLVIERRILGSEHQLTAATTYNLGCLLARLERPAEALSLIKEAVDHGLDPRTALNIEKDADLKTLHGDPRFAAIVAHAKERAAELQKAH
jgi:eukaryotic-like serine/threonine-protein kinase